MRNTTSVVNKELKERGLKKASFLLLSVLLLLIVFAGAIKIRSVNAAGVIYIRADGSVDPPTAPIQRNGDLYTLTGNISSDTDGIVIERDNMTLDGAGFTVQGAGNGTGILLQKGPEPWPRIRGLKVMNLVVRAFSTGIFTQGGSNISISGNSIAENHGDGIKFYGGTEDCSVVGNNITTNGGQAISLSGSWMEGGVVRINITRNIIMNNSGCIYLFRSGNCSISENSIVANNHTGIRVGPWSDGNVISSNCIAGNEIGIFLATTCSNKLISANNITENRVCGIQIDQAYGGDIVGNNIMANGQGVRLSGSSAKFYHNNFVNNTLQVNATPDWSNCAWDDGYPSGGNYWSDYWGVDDKNGPNQDSPGSDLIGDTPHAITISFNGIYATYIDHYPLMSFYGVPPIYPTATFSYSPSDPIAKQTHVAFNASSSSCQNGTVTAYHWSFGDGAYAMGPVTTHTYSSFGNFTITLTVVSNTGSRNTTSHSIYVREEPTAAFAYSPSSHLSVGQPITFDASSSNPQGGKLTVYVWNFGDGNTTSTINPEISHTYTVPEIFEVTLTVFDSEDLNSSTIQAVPLKMPTFVSISTSSSSTILGYITDINGTLCDFYGEGLENEPVVLYYALPSSSTWYPISQGNTDNHGRFYIQWMPQATGYFTIKAEWAGNATHLASNDTLSLSVLPYQNTYAFSVESNSTVSGLTFDTNSQTLSFSVSGENGTVGYARVTIAKALAPDITQLKVRLDGVEYSYSVTSLDDSWLLAFTYNHSSHQVEVYLDSSVIPEFPSTAILAVFMVLAILAAALTRKNRTKRFD